MLVSGGNTNTVHKPSIFVPFLTLILTFVFSAEFKEWVFSRAFSVVGRPGGIGPRPMFASYPQVSVGWWAIRRVDDATFANVLMLNLSSYRQPEGGYPAWPNTHRRLLLLSPQLGLDPVSSPRLPLLPPSATRTSLGRPRDPFNLHLILDSMSVLLYQIVYIYY